MGLQTIYNSLRSGGLSRWGALAVMGNFQAESGNEAVRVEGDFDISRSASKSYAVAVDSGKKSRNDFCYDGRGWGIYQLTFWSRKAGFYDLCKKKGVSIGDEETQIEWFFKEMESGYQKLLAFLKEAREPDLFNATYRVCAEFERPAVNNVQFRYNAACSIAGQVSDSEPTVYWPPRKLQRGMSGPDVEILQAALKARGYQTEVDGAFGENTERAINQFKKDAGLGVPGVVGTKTWKALLKV